MKATIDIPDDLYRRTKALAALRGRSFEDLVADALRAQLTRLESPPTVATGWRSVFGSAPADAVAEVDALVAEAFSQIEPAGWR